MFPKKHKLFEKLYQTPKVFHSLNTSNMKENGKNIPSPSRVCLSNTCWSVLLNYLRLFGQSKLEIIPFCKPKTRDIRLSAGFSVFSFWIKNNKAFQFPHYFKHDEESGMTNFEILKMISTQKELSYALFFLSCSDEITQFYSFWNLSIPKPSVQGVILSKIAYDILWSSKLIAFLN